MLLYLAIGVPALMALSHVFLTVTAWVYVAVDRRRTGPRPLFKGRGAVFVPCKGMEVDLEANLEAIATQDHADYTVTYIVERIADPAYDVIRRIIARRPNASIVVAGLTEKCGQKNHNLLQGIAARLGKADALVTCDADVNPDPGWLNRLTGPLSDPATPIATGFRWILPGHRTFGAYMHAIFNAYMSTMIANKQFASVWGGSLAIRRDFWDKYNVAERWATSVVDDMTVSAILVEHKIKRAYVLSCIVPSEDAITDLTESVAWFTRQILYVRYYLFPLWVIVVVLWIPTGLSPLAAPLFFAWAWHTGSHVALVAGWSTTALVALVAASLLVVRALGSPNFSAWTWFFITPLALPVGAWAIIESVLARNMRWRNIVYDIGPNGEVISIRRDDLPDGLPAQPELSISTFSGE